jgi:predicted transposase YbfD/YdcC
MRSRQIPDPRKSRGRWHPLVAILLIAACAVTCDADGFTAIWQWADDAPPWVLARLRVRPDPLTGLLRPPSDRTLRRTLTRVDSHALQQAAGAFIASRLTAVGLGSTCPPTGEREARRAHRRSTSTGATAPRTQPYRCLAADGKVLRGARRPDGTRVTVLGAAEHASGNVVTQHEIDAKSNETPKLRDMLAGMDLTGCLLTGDAAHTCKATAAEIVAAGGDYLLTLKDNQVDLLNTVKPPLAGTDEQWADRSHISHGRGHGRTEQRSVRVADAAGVEFPHAGLVFRTVRHTGGLDGQRTGKQVVYGITSLTASRATPADVAAVQRGHWGIENRTHHVRDTTFDEDHSQVRTGNAPMNMANLRNLAIDSFRANGHVNIAHARRHHAHDYNRVLDLYGL